MAFELRQQMLTKNDCYKTAQKMTPKGIVVHSTGANNPYLLRYVQPDDGKLGVNKYGNSWNRAGVEVAVHAMIGKCYDDSVACYQLLPWNIACWGVGRGNKGSYNYDPTGHIQFEICEDALTDKAYFEAAFEQAIALCVYLCKQFGLKADSIVSHKECNALGYGSDHGDPEHWLAKFGKNMEWFRKEVEKRMSDKTFKVGDTVVYTGIQCFAGKNDETAKGLRVGGKAKIAEIDEKAKHPYKLDALEKFDNSVGWGYIDGWVNADTVLADTLENEVKAYKNTAVSLRADDASVRTLLIKSEAREKEYQAEKIGLVSQLVEQSKEIENARAAISAAKKALAEVAV